MSVQLLGEVLKYSRSTGPARAVLMALAYHHDHRDPTRTVGMFAEDLVADANTHRSGLYRALDDLYGLGELVRLEGGGGRGKPTRWRIPDLEEKYAGERPQKGRFRTPKKPSARPLVNVPTTGTVSAVEASQESDGLSSTENRPTNRPRIRPEAGTDPSRVNGVGVEGKEENPPPTPPSKLGGELPRGLRSTGTNPRALGTNPRALAAGVRRAQAEEAAAAAVADMRAPDQADEHDWHAFRALLKRSVAGHSWAFALEPLQLVAVSEDGGFLLDAPDHARGWAAGRFARLLGQAAERVGRPSARVATQAESEALARAA